MASNIDLIDHPLLEVQGLNVTFKGSQGSFQAVKSLDFSISRSETLALVGESGCGKSTTALSILRLLGKSASVSGYIGFDGQNLLDLSMKRMRSLRGHKISMIFQDPMTSLNPVHTIGYQIIEAIKLHKKVTNVAAHKRAVELLDMVKIPEPHLRFYDYPHNLSGGQRQRVMIAIAMAGDPELLIADEPTTALDVSIQAQVLELLDTLCREHSMAMLLITHDLGVVAQWADRVVVMYGGEKLEENTTTKLFENPVHSYTKGLLGASLHSGNALHYSNGRLPEIHVSQVPGTDRNSFELVRPSMDVPVVTNAEDTNLMSVCRLHTSYRRKNGEFYAVNDVSFNIMTGESVGLVGESGSGKSTLCKTIMRLIPSTSGQIIFKDQDITDLNEKSLKPWRQKVQMVFQDPYASLNPRRTVFNTLDTVLRVHGVSDRNNRKQQIEKILDRVGLPSNSGKRYPHEFSGGQRQRIGIARALILRPELLVCDEPVSALDVSVQAQILNLLVELKQEFNLSYLFISHDLAVVKYIADKVLVMHAGKLVEQGGHEQIWNNPQHEYTRSLLAAVPG